jgi:FMN phosphatase YigB (HAD superfamily)
MGTKCEYISFDLWGTLIISNPEFKLNQKKLLLEINSKMDPIKWELDLKIIKNEFNFQVEHYGIHFDRKNIYERSLKEFSEKELADFITKSDELFLRFPPKVRDNSIDMINQLRSKGIKCYISSNTVLIYSNVLETIVYDYFKISAEDCNFSDAIGVSKPDAKMFNYKNKPAYHIGDNHVTDGACVNSGIEFYHINETQSFKTFLTYANL